MICEHCKASRISENAFEDGIYAIMIEWLNSVTCINWYRYYPDYRRPDGELINGVRDEQYGMIFISNYEPDLGMHTGDVELVEYEKDGKLLKDYCLNISESETFTFDLFVFRESGEMIRSEQRGGVVHGLYATDVLKQVNALIAVSEFTSLLSTAGIQINRTGKIDALVEKRESVWEWQAAATFTGTICRNVSYPISGEKLIYCVETCDGQPLCLEDKCKEKT